MTTSATNESQQCARDSSTFQRCNFITMRTGNLMYEYHTCLHSHLWLGSCQSIPSAPVYVTANRDKTSIITFPQLKNSPLELTDSLSNFSELRPLMTFTSFKTEREDYINRNCLIRTRARKKIDLYPEIHPVNWSNVPLTPSTGVEEALRDWTLNCLSGAIISALRLLH